MKLEDTHTENIFIKIQTTIDKIFAHHNGQFASFKKKKQQYMQIENKIEKLAELQNKKDRIFLNVGGICYDIPIKTITKCKYKNKLQDLLQTSSQDHPELFLDFDGVLFEAILEIMRMSQIDKPTVNINEQDRIIRMLEESWMDKSEEKYSLKESLKNGIASFFYNDRENEEILCQLGLIVPKVSDKDASLECILQNPPAGVPANLAYLNSDDLEGDGGYD